MKMIAKLMKEVKQQRREWAQQQKHRNIPSEIAGRKNS
jgi:hypothetical protein